MGASMSTSPQLRIDGARLMRDLRTLRGFGAQASGVVRQAFSHEDVRARAWLTEQYENAGLIAAFDSVGNVFGRDPRFEKAILIGSHGDTQPTGGWLDGAMGVIFGLEIARAFQECGMTAGLGVDAVCWSDEEGTFVHSLGSRHFCEAMAPGEFEAATSGSGESLTDACAQAGYSNCPSRVVSPSRYAAYLEPHIEQGPVLDAAGEQLGVVEAIVGAREFVVSFKGEANHAGTAPMASRKDAVRAMLRFTAELDRRYEMLAREGVVWTFGRIEITPNAPSIVPGFSALSVQFRAPSLKVLDAFEAALRDQLDAEQKRAPEIERGLRKVLDFVPTPMDAGLMDVLAKAADRIAPGRWRRMASGAGHDAQFLAELMPTGMLFVPSIGGVSHSFSEDTTEADIVAGCEALALAVEYLARDFGA